MTANIPLNLRLKKEIHKKIAKTQDMVVETLFSIFDDAVFHGGTAIWRCYQGNRFSEDIDVYIPRDINKIEVFFNSLIKKGFIIEKKKISNNGIYSNLRYNNTFVRFETVFKKEKGLLKEYETIESNFINVYTLTPEKFVIEKVNAYLNRLKIRDLYDIFFLLRYIKDFKDIVDDLRKLVNNYKKPLDESDLKVIIIEGLVPSSDKMFEYIKNFIRKR